MTARWANRDRPEVDPSPVTAGAAPGARPELDGAVPAPAGALERVDQLQSRDRVGRDGVLVLGFDRVGPRTVLTERRFRLPLQVLEPMDLDGSGCLTVMMLNPTGGVLGGDRLETTVRLGAGTHVCLTTPAATRVYRSAGPPSIVITTARIEDGAVLEYMPDHLIPSPGARLRQYTEIALHRSAIAFVLDAWAVGRVARGEAWRFAAIDIGLAVEDCDGPLLRDRAVLRGRGAEGGGAAGGGGEEASGAPDLEPWPLGLGGAEGLGYVATFAALAPARSDSESLAAELRDVLAGVAMRPARTGVTALARGGVVARLLLPSAPALTVAAEALWARCRARLLGRPPLPLRKL
jgi:urease accessory protein